MTKTLLEQELPHCNSILKGLGFEVYKESRSGYFGDWLVYMRSDKLNIMLSRDRDFISADVAAISDPDSWTNMSTILKLVRETGLDVRLKAPGEADDLCRVLTEAYPAMCSLFSQERYVNTKRRIEEILDRIEEHFRRTGRLEDPDNEVK